MSGQFFETYHETKAWLDSLVVLHYTIQDDLIVDVDGGFSIANQNLERIPVRFGIINGDFYCDNNRLTNLSGSPQKCTTFSCDNNLLTNLMGSPSVCNDFWCVNNPLTSLAGAAKKYFSFHCEGNQLTNLVGGPETCRYFYCYENQLTSLLGAPKKCSIFDCSNNRLIDLAGMPMECDVLRCYTNPLLADISGAPGGCRVDCDFDLIVKNQAARQLMALDGSLGPATKPGRIL